MDKSNYEKLLSVKTVAEILCCSRSTVWRRCADGTLPKPVRLGHISRWPQSEIIAVIEVAKNARALHN